MTNTADVVIIGGGVQGASLAFHLAQRGVKVVVIEKQFIGAGATGRSSGLVRMHYDLEVDSRLAWESFKYFRNWKALIGGDCGFTRTGFIQIAGIALEDALQENIKMHQRIGIPELLISADDVKRLAPSFLTDDFNFASYEPESGYASPVDTANSLMTAARSLGAQLIQGSAVTAIRVASGKIVGVDTTQDSYSAAVVVNVAGAWAGKINQMVEVDIPYTTWRHDTMFVRRPAEVGLSHPTVIDFSTEMYFRPEGELTLVGLEDGNPLGQSPDTDPSQALTGFVERAIDRICQRVPIMEQSSLHSAHGGYDGITPDQHAILGAIGPDGFYVNCGHSGTGFKTAPAVGLCMSELILDGQSRTVDISSMTPHRFTTGALIRGNYRDMWK